MARRPAKLLERLNRLDDDFDLTSPQESTKLLTPFDFLSCEQIGEDPVLLHALYSEQFLGLPEIENQNNVVVTGLRGCGKTTVFRSLSLGHKLRIKKAVPDQTRYLGIYYRCDDLSFAFPRYKVPTRDEALDIPIHFVTATLLSKLLDLLGDWCRQYFADEFRSVESNLSEALWTTLGISPPGSPDYATLKSLIAKLNKERLKAMERHRFANDQNRSIGRCFGPEVLVKTCEVLSNYFSFSRGRPFYFFIDDYSSPKVTKELQTNLNRVFMQRTSVCFFKLSTDSPVSFAKDDIDGKIYVENREFILLNLGLVYLHGEEKQKLTFIEEVFRRRLAQSKTDLQAQELTDLVGSDSEQKNNNELALQIRDKKKPLFWGKETLCKLCSGDIYYLIGLVGKMVRQSGESQKQAGGFRISKKTQNQAIREGAGEFLKNLRDSSQCGEKLVTIVEVFGNIANSHLKYLNSKNESRNPPKQATRIEPYEPLSLSQKAQQYYDELLRYSVFIEDFRGKSRRGNVVPRLYLRRFLIPHFNLTFSTRDSIELEPDEFEKFLLEPKSLENNLRLKSSDDANRYDKQQTGTKDQLSLPMEKLEE